MENLLQYGRGPSTNSVPVDNNTGIETENLLQYGNLGAIPSTLTDAVEPVFDEEYANSWGNRFAIGVDNTQASLFKGLDLIADITESEGLKKYAQEGIIKNQQEAAAKPQPTRTASFTEASKEIKQELTEDDFFGAIQRGLLLVKDMSAQALPSMLPTLGAAVAAPIVGSALGTAPLVGGTLSLATRLVAPLVPGYLMGSGETYEEAKSLNAKEKDAQKLAVMGGVGISLLERLGAARTLKGLVDDVGVKYVDDTLGKLVGKESIKEARRQADDIMKDPSLFIKRNLTLEAGKSAIRAGATEGLTEGGQEAIQIAAAGLAADKGINPYDNAEYTNRIIDGIALGAVGGATVGTGAGIVTNLQHKDVINRTEQRLKEVDDLEKATKDMSDDQIRNYIKLKKTEYKPSYLQNIFNTALAPLSPLANRNKAGYEIYNALASYNDNVSASVGQYAKPLDEALQYIRKSIKAPLIQGSLNKRKNKELYNFLQYGTKSKDPDVQEAAKIIRRDILGNALSPEVKITKDSLRKGLLENKTELEEVTKARELNKLDTQTEQNINTQWNSLKELYQGKLKAIEENVNNDLTISPIMKQETIRQEQEKVINNSNLLNSEPFKNLNNAIVAKAESTGLYGALNESDLSLAFTQNYFPRVYNFGLFSVIGSKLGMGKIAKAKKILRQQGMAEQDINGFLDNVRGNDGVYVPETDVSQLDILLDARDNTKTTQESKASIEKRREIKPETFKKLEKAGLVETDVKKILDKYILQANQRNEVRKVKQIIDPALKELQQGKNIDIGEVDRIKDIYQAIQNRYKSIQDEKFKKAMRFYLTYQYILTLPLAALTALSEPIIVLSRVDAKHFIPATMKALTNTYRQAVRSVLPKFKKSEAEQAFMGILQGFDGTLAERLGDIAGVDVVRKVTDKFFKATMLTQITQFSRDIAFQAMSRQIADDIKILAVANQKGLTKKETTKFRNARKRLSELGLIENNLRTKNPNASDAVKWAEGQIPAAQTPEIIRKALSKGVDDIIMAPNVVNRPLWMSNPHLALFAQLKGFMYTFGLKVGGRILTEVVKPLFKGRVPVSETVKYGTSLVLIIAASMAIKEMKDEIRYGDEDSNWKDATGAERLVSAIISTNVLGGVTGLYDALGSSKYGVSPIESVLGPGAIHFSKLIQAISQANPLTQANPRALSTHIARSIPGVAAVDPTKVSEISDVIEEFLLQYYS
jgi:hypothetical protein